MGEIIEGNLAEEFIERQTILEKIRQGFVSKWSRYALISLGFLAITQIGKPKGIEIGSHETPEAKIVMDDNSELQFNNWDHFDPNENSESVEISSKSISQVISSENDILKDEGLLPIKISNEEQFHQWVEKEAIEPEKLNDIGVNSINETNAKQLIELSALIVGENLDYSRNVDQLDKSAKRPVDEILEKHLPAECGHYAVSMTAVFNELKKDNPKLANIYLNTVSTPAHVYNQIISVNDPDKASIAYYDPTALDVSWGNVFLENENFMDLLNDWKEKNLLNDSKYLDLASEYYTQNNADSSKELDFIESQLFKNDNHKNLDVMISMTKNFINKPIDKEQKKQATNFLEEFQRERSNLKAK